MESNEKDCIEYALHAYDTYWEYYKKTLDERNQIINNYIVFVGIPITVLGLIADKVKNNINNYICWLVLALMFILILGFVIFNAYIVEGFISEKYLKKINHISNYLIKNYDSDYKKVFSESYSLNDLFLNKKDSKKHRLRKSFLIIIVNTVNILCIFCLIQKCIFRWYSIILSLIISALVHLVIFIYQMKRN